MIPQDSCKRGQILHNPTFIPKGHNSQKGRKSPLRPVLRKARRESTKSNPQTKATSNPKKASSGIRTPQEAGPKTGEPCAQVGKDPNTPAAKGQLGMWFRIKPVRNVYPPIRQTGTRTVKVLVLASPIHDQKVTMVKPARAHFTIRAGLRLPLERSGRP